MAHRRVNISLPPDLHDRARALVDRLPGATFSALVEDALLQMIPVMEDVLGAYEDGGEDAALRAVESNLGRVLLTHGTERGVSDT